MNSILPFLCSNFGWLLLASLVATPGGLSAVPKDQLNLVKGGVALSGYDPVSYFLDGGPQKGSKTYLVEREGVTYLFANEANMETFLVEPAKYQPEFGGWCAWAMLAGDKVEVDPESYTLYEGKLLLFYNGFWGDTLKKWKDKSEKESESTLYETSATNWRTILKS